VGLKVFPDPSGFGALLCFDGISAQAPFAEHALSGIKRKDTRGPFA
jgi:hypothetical protein